MRHQHPRTKSTPPQLELISLHTVSSQSKAGTELIDARVPLTDKP